MISVFAFQWSLYGLGRLSYHWSGGYGHQRVSRPVLELSQRPRATARRLLPRLQPPPRAASRRPLGLCERVTFDLSSCRLVARRSAGLPPRTHCGGSTRLARVQCQSPGVCVPDSERGLRTHDLRLTTFSHTSKKTVGTVASRMTMERVKMTMADPLPAVWVFS